MNDLAELPEEDEDDFLPERDPNECSECGKPIVKGSPYGVCESCRLGPI